MSKDKTKNITNVAVILKQIIAIPSWVDDKTNEAKLGNWIVEYLEKNSKLSVTRQNLANGRFNIIATNSKITDTLVVGHIDTVQPNANWTKKPIKPQIKGDKLFGLGATDMKCGIAIMLYLATLPNLAKNTTFLFYCDEEYDFLGMQKFIAEFKSKIKPKLIISLDGDELKIGNSCRGLIEIKFIVQGKTGHAARPKSGINSIIKSQKIINDLDKWLSRFSTKYLGKSTLNVAYFAGGTKISTNSNEVVFGRQGNIIPDYCEYIVEIRTASEKLNAKLVKEFIENSNKKEGLATIKSEIRHDLGSWITPPKQLQGFIKLAPVSGLINAKERGYLDIQMLYESFNKVPAFSIGAGEKGQAHSSDEYVKLSQVRKCQRFIESILTNK